jgi:hypothetical protein
MSHVSVIQDRFCCTGTCWYGKPHANATVQSCTSTVVGNVWCLVVAGPLQLDYSYFARLTTYTYIAIAGEGSNLIAYSSDLSV